LINHAVIAPSAARSDRTYFSGGIIAVHVVAMLASNVMRDQRLTASPAFVVGEPDPLRRDMRQHKESCLMTRLAERGIKIAS
jgi:hypothetical protein